jgi:hypothetical protein
MNRLAVAVAGSFEKSTAEVDSVSDKASSKESARSRARNRARHRTVSSSGLSGEVLVKVGWWVKETGWLEASTTAAVSVSDKTSNGMIKRAFT